MVFHVTDVMTVNDVTSPAHPQHLLGPAPTQEDSGGLQFTHSAPAVHTAGQQRAEQSGPGPRGGGCVCLALQTAPGRSPEPQNGEHSGGEVLGGRSEIQGRCPERPTGYRRPRRRPALRGPLREAGCGSQGRREARRSGGVPGLQSSPAACGQSRGSRRGSGSGRLWRLSSGMQRLPPWPGSPPRSLWLLGADSLQRWGGRCNGK